MNPFLLVVIIVFYLGIITILGIVGYKKTTSSADFLLAGRNTHPYIMAVSYGATFISTSAIVGFGGLASLYGFSMIWMVFVNIAVGIFFAFVFLGKRTRRMGLNLDAHTFPELMARRVNSRFIQIASGLIIFIFMPLYAAAVLIGAARIIESFLAIPYEYSVVIFSVLVAAYVLLGGLKGVMYTDALQGTLMFMGMLVLIIFTYWKLGGVIHAHQQLGELSDLIPSSIVSGGIDSWTAFPRVGSPIWWTLCSSLILGVGVGVLAQPQLVVRFMTVKSDRELNRAVIIGAVFIFVAVGAAYIIGPLSNVYFFETQGQISLLAAGGNIDRVIPEFIINSMPDWFVYVFLLVILSAAMSTLSSQFHTIGTSIGRDFYEEGLKQGKSKIGGMIVTKVGIILSLIATVFLGLNIGAGVIARATAIFFGLMASSFLAPYIAALYWKRLTRKGAVAGIVTGFIATIFCFLFIHEKEAAVFGLCKAICGNIVLVESIKLIDPMVFAFPLSILAMILVSLLTKVEDQDLVDRAFVNMTGGITKH